jgi:hypothetical protein
MHYIHLIILSDFIQVLNSARKVPSKNQYFSKHELFYTNSLLQEHRLNSSNYSMQELIMGIFVRTTDHGMSTNAEVQSISKYRYL